MNGVWRIQPYDVLIKGMENNIRSYYPIRQTWLFLMVVRPGKRIRPQRHYSDKRNRFHVILRIEWWKIHQRKRLVRVYSRLHYYLHRLKLFHIHNGFITRSLLNIELCLYLPTTISQTSRSSVTPPLLWRIVSIFFYSFLLLILCLNCLAWITSNRNRWIYRIRNIINERSSTTCTSVLTDALRTFTGRILARYDGWILWQGNYFLPTLNRIGLVFSFVVFPRSWFFMYVQWTIIDRKFGCAPLHIIIENA